MTGCNHNDCFTCPYADCIGERKAEPRKRGRKPLPVEEKQKRKKAYAQAYYKKNREKLKAYMSKYYREHKEEYRAREQKYREMREIWNI